MQITELGFDREVDDQHKLHLSVKVGIPGGDGQGDGTLLTELNYSLLSWVILFNILEMADVETADNFATSVKGILNSFANRSAIPERTRGILPRRLP